MFKKWQIWTLFVENTHGTLGINEYFFLFKCYISLILQVIAIRRNMSWAIEVEAQKLNSII